MSTGRKLVSDNKNKNFLFNEFITLVKNKQSIKNCLIKLNISLDEYKLLKLELNKPETKWTCSICNIKKPNLEYVKDNYAKKHRHYVPQCKPCRKEYIEKFKTTDSFINSKIKGRKKNRITMIFNSSKGNALKRNLEHSISRLYIEQLYKKQKGLCYYSNQPMYIDLTNQENNENSISLDRIDSNKGYIENNVVLCRWVVNRIKNDLSADKFFNIIKEIYKYNKL